MKRLIQEVHRRSLWQVLGIYLAASWVALQVVSQLAESVGLPEWVEPFAVVLLVIGLPIVLATAFVQDGAGAKRPEPQPAVAPDARHAEAAAAPAAGVAAGEGAAATPEAARVRTDAPRRVRNLLSWRNALLGGALAFVLLAVVTWGFMTMRDRGIGPVGSLVAKGLLDERAPLVLAEFDSRDPELARTVTEVLRIDLSQSEIVRLVETTALDPALARMGREPGTAIDTRLAREIAVREGYPAVIAGEINRAGGRFVVSAQVLKADDGTVLASHRETAADSSEIIPAMDRLSSKLRERIGESYADLRATPPLEQVTTGSLDALRLYSQALEAENSGDWEQARDLLESAVEEDPGFAMAWRKMGVLLRNRGVDGKRAFEAFTKAHEHRDRLTTRERYLTEGSYYMEVTGDLERARTAYESLLDLRPSDSWALNNVAILYDDSGDPERALDLYRRSADADSTNILALSNGSHVLMDLGRPTEAEAMLRVAMQRSPRDAKPLQDMVFVYAVQGEFDRARAVIDTMVDTGSSSAYWRYQGAEKDASLSFTRGQYEQGTGELGEALSILDERGLGGQYVDEVQGEAMTRLVAARDTAGAVRLIDEALRRYPLDDMPEGDAPLLNLALFWATAGRFDRADAMLARYDPATSTDRAPWPEIYRTIIDALRAAGGDDPMSAAPAVRRLKSGACGLCYGIYMGRLYEAAGMPDSAIVAYQDYVETPYFLRGFTDHSYLPPILERVAQLADAQGDTETAAVYYARFVDLWKDADPELQPRVTAARTRLQEILKERG